MIRLMDYPQARHEIEIFVGADRVVRINVDGQCAMRAKLGPEAQFVIRGQVRYRADSPWPSTLVTIDPTEPA